MVCRRLAAWGIFSKKVQGFFGRHVQHVGDVFALVGHLQGFAVVAGPFADLALHIHIRQEVHLDHVHPLATAGFAASTFDVEGKAPRLVAPGLGLDGFGKQVADDVEHPRIGGRVRPGGAANGGLVDDDHLIQGLQPLDFVQVFGKGHLAAEVVLQGWVQQLIHQGRFARARHPGNAHQLTQGNVHIQVFQVVAVGIFEGQRATIARRRSAGVGMLQRPDR
jgi:hypothetical protein